MTPRTVAELIPAKAASDGDGVRLLRVFGGRGPERFDPFLMLDEFGSSEPQDYIGGFPPHPHRGFETVTYMLQGKMEHQDHMGNIGLLEDGDVQWMSAAGGIIHSEMPKQTEGRMRGFQLWVNLPAAKKMQPASYSDVKSADIPVVAVKGACIKAIAGKAVINNTAIVGRFTQAPTQPVFVDAHIAVGQSISLPLPQGYTALLYVYEGAVAVNDTHVSKQNLARLINGDTVVIHNPNGQVAQVLLLAAEPLREPIVQYGPFVMNTMAQIEQALEDYKNGTLAQ